MKALLRIALLVAVAGSSTAAFAHEERVVSGKVEGVDRRTIIVSETPGAKTRTISLAPDTEIMICRRRADLNGVSPGMRARVKYVEAPRAPAAARAIFLMRSQ
jgi:hypothetical protein